MLFNFGKMVKKHQLSQEPRAMLHQFYIMFRRPKEVLSFVRILQIKLVTQLKQRYLRSTVLWALSPNRKRRVSCYGLAQHLWTFPQRDNFKRDNNGHVILVQCKVDLLCPVARMTTRNVRAILGEDSQRKYCRKEKGLSFKWWSLSSTSSLRF